MSFLCYKKLATNCISRTDPLLKSLSQNVQGTNSDGQETNSDGQETRPQINGLDQKEEINSQPEQNKGIRIQKYEERFGNL